MTTRVPRKIFDVYIYDKQYGVYDIEGREHEGLNGEPKTWWLYFSDELPEGLTPPHDSDSFKPFHKSISRRVWEVRIKQQNTAKEKWGDTNFRNHTRVEMWCNGRQVYEFGTTGGSDGLGYALAKVKYLEVQIGEHVYNFFEPEKERGRKIWFDGMPAIVQPRNPDGWEIRVYPDYSTGYTKETWWAEYAKRQPKANSTDDAEMDEEELQEMIRSEYINWGDALSDGHINWFRN